MSVEGINYDNMFVRMLSRLGDAMILSVLFVVTCIPLVTIGASVTALHYASMKSLALEDGYVFKFYLKGFKDNFKKSTVMWLLFVLAFFVFGVDIWFWQYQIKENASSVSQIMFIVSIVLIVIAFAMFLYAFPLQAKFENSIKVQLRNSFLLSIKYFPTTIGMILISLLVAGIFYYQPALAVVGFAMVGIGILGYLFAFLMLRCFKPYLPEMKRIDDEENFELVVDDETDDDEDIEVNEDAESEVTDIEANEDDESTDDNDRSDNEVSNKEN